jgi:TPR repeat protein
MADGDLSNSVLAFVGVKRANSSPQLSRQSQRQLRRICAMYLYRAEEKEDSGAMCALGAAYEHGWGVGEDPQQAKRWYRDAANAGNVAAMGALAKLYEHEFGATVHTAAAHEWYRQQTVIWYHRAAAGGGQAASQWLLTHNLN